MGSSRTLNERLSEHRLEHKVLCAFQDDIHQLVRLVTAGLLFEQEKERFFTESVTPVVEKLIAYLRHTYGPEHPRVANLSPTALVWEMQAIEHLVRSDIEAALNNDPATDDALEVIICYPGFKATRYHRLAHIFYRHSIPLLPRLISELAHQETGIDIHPGAQIGANFFIDHGTGVVIGETAIIGKNVTLYQSVTLGAKRFYRDDKGIVVKGNARHPIIGDGVTIYAGATILGRITIGDGSSIGGNVWLTESVPPKSRVTQQRYLSSYFTDGDGI
jgi:serine O-acetyltransferase